MKRIMAFDNVFMMAVSVVSLLGLTGCGSSYSVKQPLAAIPLTTGIYAMGSCETQDNRANDDVCNALQEQVRYELLKKGLYEKNVNEAPREVNLTITYFRNVGGWTRACLGVMSGKDGIDVTVEVVDKQSGTLVGRATAGYFNVSAANSTAQLMAHEVTKKIVEFLASGKVQ